MTDNHLCNCASADDAIATARKLFIDMTASDCPVWAFGVAVALRTIAIEKLKERGMPTAAIMAKANDLVDRTKDSVDIEMVDIDVAEKRKKLYGG